MIGPSEKEKGVKLDFFHFHLIHCYDEISLSPSHQDRKLTNEKSSKRHQAENDFFSKNLVQETSRISSFHDSMKYLEFYVELLGVCTCINQVNFVLVGSIH